MAPYGACEAAQSTARSKAQFGDTQQSQMPSCQYGGVYFVPARSKELDPKNWTHGDPWGPMGPHGNPWGPMGTHGDPWEPMIPHGDPWEPMGSHGDPWGPMGTHGNPWGPMGTHGDPWEPMGTHGNPVGRALLAGLSRPGSLGRAL